MAVREPYPLPVRLDADAQRLDGGRALLAGSPVVLFRLGGRGQRVVDAIERGDPLDADARPLVERLIDTGAAHPQPAASAGPGRDTVTAVVPALGPLPAELLAALDGTAGAVVVDDAQASHRCTSRAPLSCATRNRGPAGARNSGLGEKLAPSSSPLSTRTASRRRGGSTRSCLTSPTPVSLSAAPACSAGMNPAPARCTGMRERRSPAGPGCMAGPVAPGTPHRHVPGAAFVALRHC